MPPPDSPPPSPPAASEPDSSASPGHTGDAGASEAVASVDVSDNHLELALPARSGDAGASSLYIYKNAFNLIPRSVRDLGRLRTLKFFSNEINVLPPEAAGELDELECLQVKVSAPVVSGLPLQKLRALKELELSRVPTRPSAFSILTEIANLKCLTRLSICNFSIRFLPPEIGCLNKLEDLDLSFNKLKCLPDDIASLNALKSLKVTNNKLVDLPSALSALEMLENLDLSNNRLTSLQSLDLSSMRALQNLNLQYNKLRGNCQVPSWICCNMDRNRKDGISCNELNMSLVEGDVDVPIPDVEGSSCEGCSGISSTISDSSSSNSRYPSARRLRKGWKRRDLLQRRARQERLNSSRKLNSESHSKVIKQNMARESSLQSIVEKEDADAPEVSGKHDLHTSSGLLDDQSCIIGIGKRDESSSTISDIVVLCKKFGQEGDEEDSVSLKSVSDEHEGHHASLTESSSNNTYHKSKRHSDRDLDSPKPRKCLRPVVDSLLLSFKYNQESLCSTNDRMPDGFYDAGRDRPFMTLQNYEHTLSFDSREVILVDRKEDEELDAIVLAAQVLLSSLRWSHSSSKENKGSFVDNLQRASVLALFVSDCFGGSERSTTVMRARKAVLGSNYEQPFVCTCSSGNNNDGSKASSKQVYGAMDDYNFIDLCERTLHSIKRRRKSNIVPIGSLRFGVCRHRALLMKYLCDRATPPIPCELVRGYLDFMPHAWNAVLVHKGDSWVRMVVDACYPTDIREETNPEYFFRYVPLTRVHAPVTSDIFISSECLFPSLSPGDEAEKTASSVVMQCKFGNLEAAAKVRTFEAEGKPDEEIKKFEYSCLGEVRILGALRKHHCIVEIYGHQLLSKWVPSTDANKRHRLLQFKIMMEYVKGGSLKHHLEKLAKEGEKHVPMQLALSIAKDVASALVEVHAKQIIHRDIKSENVLIDLDSQKSDGTPVVKLCDFDRAVPLQSFSHTCCIGHLGVAPPDVCVGTPRWMAPEVLRAMHTHNQYGLEVDIWSYGCLLLELLTLQVPYASLPPAKINHLLQSSQRPSLTPELEALDFSESSAMTGSDVEIPPEADIKIMRFLVDLFHQCTRANPSDRPTAQVIYDMLCSAKCKSEATIAK